MTKKDQLAIIEVGQYITKLEHIREELSRSNNTDACHAADHTLRLARALLTELQKPNP